MNRLMQMLDGRRVAIVGNAPVGRDCSAEIDSADVVVRFNHFYNYASGRVGRRVDIVLQTVAKAWFDAAKAGAANIGVVREQNPAIFLVKRPDHYTTDVHAVYGRGVRVDNLARLFEPWWKYTTGTAALCYLAKALSNAEVRCYGFATGEGEDESWGRYVRTDASHYAATADEERTVMRDCIERLESLRITRSGDGAIPRCVVVPLKENSAGAPGKNAALVWRCMDRVVESGLPVYLAGDAYSLMTEVCGRYGDLVKFWASPAIPAFRDVTETLRDWTVATGFCGDVALVQCTSPGLRTEWIGRALDGLRRASVCATCTDLGFKPTAIFREENGVFVPVSERLPPATVARQMLPRAVRFTGAVTAFHTDALALPSIFLGGVLEPVMVDAADALDVDTPADLERALAALADGGLRLRGRN